MCRDGEEAEDSESERKMRGVKAEEKKVTKEKERREKVREDELKCEEYERRKKGGKESEQRE